MGGGRLVHVCKQSCGSDLGELPTHFNWILWFVLYFSNFLTTQSKHHCFVLYHLLTFHHLLITLILLFFVGNKRSSNAAVVAGSNGGGEEVASSVIEAAAVEEEAIDNLPSTNLLKGKVPSMQSESKHR